MRLPARSTWLAGAIALVALLQLARLGSFTFDGGRRGSSMLPLYDTFVWHSCLSAYHRAAELVRAGEEDVYDPHLYGGAEGRFHQEIYEYPPPFLLLARAADWAAGHDFVRLRFLWGLFLVGTVVAALAAAARAIGGAAGREAGLLAPAVLASMPTLLALQYGNFHLAAVALSVLALLGLRSGGRFGPPVGAAVLAFVIWSKVFPALLLVLLAVERRWRAIGWTAAWGVIWLLLGIALLGPAPTVAFFDHHLGHVASGTAFPFLAENERVIAANLSAYGLLLKVRALLGFTLLPAPGRSSAALGLLLVAAVAIAAARQRRLGDDPLASLRLALAALFLGALVSPFAPQPYAGFAGLWLLTWLVPGAPPPRAAILLAAWLALAVMVHALPLHPGGTLLALSLAGQIVGATPAVWVLVHRPGDVLQRRDGHVRGDLRPASRGGRTGPGSRQPDR